MMRREADVLRFIAATLNYFFERRERFAFTPVHWPDREDGRCGANGEVKILGHSAICVVTEAPSKPMKPVLLPTSPYYLLNIPFNFPARLGSKLLKARYSSRACSLSPAIR